MSDIQKFIGPDWHSDAFDIKQYDYGVLICSDILIASLTMSAAIVVPLPITKLLDAIKPRDNLPDMRVSQRRKYLWQD